MNFLRFKKYFSKISTYLLSRKVSIDTNLRMFQYKIPNNILYINKQLFLIKKILNCVPTVDYKMKQLITFLQNVNLLSSYEEISEIIVIVALIF